ncbi:MAG: hypothetical protein F4060_02160 [Holophagales bacterium]|nr:hypothetical protein [Holophagales bacterium]MYG30043.1 hypothetical protein [Holophagales bacterium]MYI78722.1 hypothetical protein [Holophagales bacterium]
MGAASHFLEDEGVATTGISLVRDNTERMELPRFLWVPFELGRPFGAPHEPDFQRRVLRAALGLLERRDGPVILEDFPDDAPGDDDGPAWSCPVSFAGAAADDGGLVGAVLAELRRLAPWQEMYAAQRGRSAPPASGLSHEQIVRGLSALAIGVRDPAVATNLPLPEWVRLGCDDLRTWYMEAAQGRPGRATSLELRDWFWRETALARLIGAAGVRLAGSEHRALRMFGRRAMVPRVYMDDLMPGVEPYI